MLALVQKSVWQYRSTVLRTIACSDVRWHSNGSTRRANDIVEESPSAKGAAGGADAASAAAVSCDPVQTNTQDDSVVIKLKLEDEFSELMGVDHIAFVGRKRQPLSQRLKRYMEKQSRKAALEGFQKLPASARYKPVETPNKVPVPSLAHGLDRVLFNPGVHYLKDPRSDKYNFDPFLEFLTQPVDFDYNALQAYVTSSQDETLIDMARQMNKRYVGSTSSVSSALCQVFFFLAHEHTANISCLSPIFAGQSKRFTRALRAPATFYLKWKNGVYAVDAEKNGDFEESVLAMMGKSMEKLLTTEETEFKKYLKEHSSQLPADANQLPESYAYGEIGDMLLRAQLDCLDPRLPRRTFDLKTRAVLPVRLDVRNYEQYVGYSLKYAQGFYESFEREYYDMIRSAFLKYNFQTRIGNMDGILVAFHNTRKLFGFQYITREEMDSRLFGNTPLGDRAFQYTLQLFQVILDRATEKYPERTLRISLKGSQKHTMQIFVEAIPSNEPVHDSIDPETVETTTEEKAKASLIPYENITEYTLCAQSHIGDKPVENAMEYKRVPEKWRVYWRLEEANKTPAEIRRGFAALRKRQAFPRQVGLSMEMFKQMSQESLREERLAEQAKDETDARYVN